LQGGVGPAQVAARQAAQPDQPAQRGLADAALAQQRD
jgi:hypothetical protein